MAGGHPSGSSDASWNSAKMVLPASQPRWWSGHARLRFTGMKKVRHGHVSTLPCSEGARPRWPRWPRLHLEFRSCDCWVCSQYPSEAVTVSKWFHASGCPCRCFCRECSAPVTTAQPHSDRILCGPTCALAAHCSRSRAQWEP